MQASTLVVLAVPTVLPQELNPNNHGVSERTRRRARAELQEQITADARNYVRAHPEDAWPIEIATVGVTYVVSRSPRAAALLRAYRPRDPDNAATAGSKAVMDALVRSGMLVDDSARHVPWSVRWRIQPSADARHEALVITVDRMPAPSLRGW